MARLSFKKIKIEQGRQLSDPGLYPRELPACMAGNFFMVNSFDGSCRYSFSRKLASATPAFTGWNTIQVRSKIVE